MYLTVKNVGKGPSLRDTQANIANLSGDGLMLHAGRFDVSNIKPGDVRKVVFSFDVEQHLHRGRRRPSRSGRRPRSPRVRQREGEDPDLAAHPAPGQRLHHEGWGGGRLCSCRPKGERARLRPAPGRRRGQAARRGARRVPQDRPRRGRFAFVAAREVAHEPAGRRQSRSRTPAARAAPRSTSAAAPGDDRRHHEDHAGRCVGQRAVARHLHLRRVAGSSTYKSNRDGADPKKAEVRRSRPARPGST